MADDKVTIQSLRKQKQAGQRITMLTCYDATFARLLDATGVDILLVGDSLGMVIQGHGTTLPVTLDEMIYHCRAVARVTRRAQVVGDMPFMSYQASIEDGLRSAGRMVKEGGCEGVKLEGGAQHAELVSRLVASGIPVMGHIGLTPQSVHQMGGFKVQGKGHGAAQRLVDDAKALEQAGAYSIVLEGMPMEVAREVTRAVSVPTIGIGAGPDCDGQVLVIYDLLGMDDAFKPRFVRKYENFALRVRTAVSSYVEDVRAGRFPSADESFSTASPQAAAATGTGPIYSTPKKD
jgi:3-methyl-2-oxobutanoate hydroxymethyltransferase